MFISARRAVTPSTGVWKITKSTGILTIVAGTYYYGYSGDGGLAVNAQLNIRKASRSITRGTYSLRTSITTSFREVNAGTGIITTIAGTPQTACSGVCGDGGPAQVPALLSNLVWQSTRMETFLSPINIITASERCPALTVTSTGGVLLTNAGQTAGDILHRGRNRNGRLQR